MDSKYIRALKAAFPYAVPNFAGFWFLGLTDGIYMNASGFSFWYPCLMSLTIFAGSVEQAPGDEHGAGRLQGRLVRRKIKCQTQPTIRRK